MAFYKYSTLNNELIEISDFELSPGNNQAVSEFSDVTSAELEKREWYPINCTFSDTPKRKLTKKEFLKKLTPIEYAAIKNAASADAIIDYYWQLFMVAEFIDLDDHDVLSGLAALERVNLIGIGRAMEIIQ